MKTKRNAERDDIKDESTADNKKYNNLKYVDDDDIFFRWSCYPHMEELTASDLINLKIKERKIA